MDYILQIEKLDKYLDFNIEAHDKLIVKQLFMSFNNDLNLIGCFVKDFLTIENNGKISDDEYIYNDFVLCFEKYKNLNQEIDFLNKLLEYGEYYLTIAFEDTVDRVLLNTIVSVNSCFAMEYYPFLMELMDKFLNKKIDGISYALMLQSITDTVFRNFESSKAVNVDLNTLRNELELIISSQNNERIAI